MKLVLLPGLDGTGDLFTRFNSCLPADIEPIIIRYPNTDWGYEKLLPFVLEHLPASEPYVLLGESFSGPLAISIASQKPPNLIALILVCTFARNPQPIAIGLALKIRYLPPSFLQRVAIRYGLTHGRALEGLDSEVMAAVQTLSPSTIWARFKAIANVNVLGDAQSIECPTLYLYASQDRLIPRSSVNDLTKRIKKLQVIDIAGSHCLLQSNPAHCAKEVSSFARSVVE